MPGYLCGEQGQHIQWPCAVKQSIKAPFAHQDITKHLGTPTHQGTPCMRTMQELSIVSRSWRGDWLLVRVVEREPLAGLGQRVVLQSALTVWVNAGRQRGELLGSEELLQRLPTSVGSASHQPSHPCIMPQHCGTVSGECEYQSTWYEEPEHALTHGLHAAPERRMDRM